MLYKLLCAAMVIVFLLAAGVQLNDPDPSLWIVLYLSAVALTILHVLRRAPLVVIVILTLVYGAGVAYLSHRFPDTSLQAFKSVGMSSIVEEEVRELWGLVILTGWSLIMLVRQFLKRNTEE